MFTGIVEETATVTRIEDREDSSLIELSASASLGEIGVGDSVSVNGACLTALSWEEGIMTFETVKETLLRTTLGDLVVGDLVNLELAMAASGRFDGHIVQGHVDGSGTVIAIDHDAGSKTVSISTDEGLITYVVEKGSITVDGVSLTVVSVEHGGFTVSLIPHTLSVTTLGNLEVGSTVNIEVDIIAKYVERMLDK